MQKTVAALAVFLVLAFVSLPAVAQNPPADQPAPQSGEKLVQCVTFKWEAPGDKARISVDVWVFGKSVAQAELTPKSKDLKFEFEDGFLVAQGELSATFEEFEGTGDLLLDTLTYACDFSGEYKVEKRRVTAFEYLARFEY